MSGQPNKDSRGFTTFDEFQCSRQTNVRIKESSAADEPCIWLFLEENPRVFTDPKPGNASAHLSLDHARRLVAALQDAIHNHYQVRG